LSAVIACYRDAPAVPIMYKRLVDTFEKIGVDYEIIFVNDASPDDAKATLAELASRDSKVVVINHTRNFGSQNAFTSGMRISTGDAVVLLHGRNFPSSYWAPVIKTLNEAGYRVLVPDQIGFGKSSKPFADLHFDTLARNTIALLDHLQIARADIVAHSMGGMIAARIARAYPDRVQHLLLAAPIGLEDYRLYGPPTPTEKIMEHEDKLTADGYRKQLETNYSLKLPPDQVTPFIDAPGS